MQRIQVDWATFWELIDDKRVCKLNAIKLVLFMGFGKAVDFREVDNRYIVG